MNPEPNFHFNLGEMRCTIIQDWIETFPGFSIAKNVPVEHLTPALQNYGIDPSTTCMNYQCLFIQAAGRSILVDTGIGRSEIKPDSVVAEKLRASGMEMMLKPRQGWLPDGLAAQGIAAEEVHAVIITHGDSDHTGGLITPEQQSVFANARIYLAQESWDFWSDPSHFNVLPDFMTLFGRKVLPAIREQVEVIKPGDEFLPGIRFLAAPGHRPGHAGLLITSGGQTLIHSADTFGHALLVEYPEWQGFADFDHTQARLDRLALINLAVCNQAQVFASHITFPGLGKIVPDAGRWCWYNESSHSLSKRNLR